MLINFSEINVIIQLVQFKFFNLIFDSNEYQISIYIYDFCADTALIFWKPQIF